MIISTANSLGRGVMPFKL